MHILCPHCRNPIEIVKITQWEEIACPSCGSSFCLEQGATTGLGNSSGHIIGKFHLMELLGQGAFGSVYKARDPELDRTVAIKVPRAGNLAGPQEMDRFLREARSVAQLRHPSIVSIHEVGEQDGVPYLVSDFVQGMTLADLLSARRLSFRAAAELIAGVADALQYAHERGVVHRDIKPSNIMIGDDGKPWVMDFGLAKREAGEITMTIEGQVLGTPAYMPPEQARGEGHSVDARGDVYSLGVVLYQLLTGELPFRGTTRMLLHQVLSDEPRPPRRLNDSIPRDLETICLKCLHKEVRKRYATARALIEDLRRFLDGEPIQARPVGGVERALKWMKRRPAVAGLLAGIVLIASLGMSGILWKYFDAEHQKSLAQDEKDRAQGLAEDYRTQKVVADEKTWAAEKAEQKAKDEAKRATEEEAKRKRELDRAEGLVYAGCLLQAQLFWDAGNALAARDRLDACRWDYRNWEHALLRRQFDETSATLKGDGSLWSVAFSPDGKRLASASGDKTVKVWDADTGQVIFSLQGHTSIVSSVNFSPDGKRLASASLDMTVKVWDAATGRELLTFKGHREGVNSVAFSPDGKRLASASGDGTTKVWDAATGRELLTFKGHNVASVCFSPDGKRLASGGGDGQKTGEVKLWDATTGQELISLKGLTGYVASVSFSPDGKRLASANQGGDIFKPAEVKVWEAVTGQELLSLKGHTSSLVASVSFSPDGKRLASASHDRTVKLWDAVTGQELRSLKGHTSAVLSVSFSPDGKRLASASGDNTVKVWDATGEDVLTLKGHLNIVTSVCFSSDAQHLASAAEGQIGKPREVKVWDTTGQHLFTLLGGGTSVSFSPDGRRIGSGSKVWDASTRQDLFTLEGGGGIQCFSPDGKRLAGGNGDGTVKVWDAATGRELLTFKGHTGDVTSVSFSPDGKRLASAGGHFDKTVKLWDAATGQELLSLKGNTGWVNSVSFSPDGKRLATGGGDGQKPGELKLWDATTGQQLLSLKGHTHIVRSVTFSPDGKRLASASGDQIGKPGELKLWDAASGLELLNLKGHTQNVASVNFSPDGKRLASASWDMTVKVWDAASGQETRPLNGHTSNVSSVSFSLDGKRVIARSEADEVRSWDAVTGQEIVPCTDPPPAAVAKEAVSPDGTLRATSYGYTVRVVRNDDQRPSSDVVFLKRLNDPGARLRWHRQEADASEKASQWFAAAFHLRQLLASQEPDAVQLEERLKVCENNLKQP